MKWLTRWGGGRARRPRSPPPLVSEGPYYFAKFLDLEPFICFL